MSTFTAVIATHDNSGDAMAWTLSRQTRKPDELIVLTCCGPWATERANISVRDKHHNDWGASKCDVGLRLATCDYVGFFAIDDDYAPDYVEKMMTVAEATQAEIVHCHFDSKNCGLMRDPQPRVGRITRGSFIVDRAFAVGYGGYHYRHYEADGRFIEDLVSRKARVVVVPELLYWHR